MIVRSIHAKNYVVINKKALEDPKLSFKAKGLWAYCLSRPNDWQFHVSHLATVSCEGEKAIYSALKELIQNGYCLHGRIKDPETGYFTAGNYVILEQQNTKEEIEKIKKELSNWVFDPQPQKGDDGKGDDGKEALLSTEEQPSIEKEINTDVPTPSEIVTTQGKSFFQNKKTKAVSGTGYQQAVYFQDKLLKLHPKLKKPNLYEWANELDRMFRIDKRTHEEITSMIDWALEDSFWCSNILSPSALRRNYDKMNAKKHKPEVKGDWINRNRAEAYELVSDFKSNPKGKLMKVTDKELLRSDTQELIAFTLHPDKFKSEICRVFGLRRSE